MQQTNVKCINGYELLRTDFSKVLLEEDIVQALEKIFRTYFIAFEGSKYL